jgi:hypothetical protein
MQVIERRAGESISTEDAETRGKRAERLAGRTAELQLPQHPLREGPG